MANSLDWNVCYHGKDFVYLVSYLLAVSYGSVKMHASLQEVSLRLTMT